MMSLLRLVELSMVMMAATVMSSNPWEPPASCVDANGACRNWCMEFRQCVQCLTFGTGELSDEECNACHGRANFRLVDNIPETLEDMAKVCWLLCLMLVSMALLTDGLGLREIVTRQSTQSCMALNGDCPGTCVVLKDCVRCQVFDTGPLTPAECYHRCAHGREIMVVEELHPLSAGFRLCRLLDDDGCVFEFAYKRHSDGGVEIKSARGGNENILACRSFPSVSFINSFAPHLC
ncbi:hypothetical protein BaRGS_00005445 [Batillaria attramentaria]|uniref:Integrin beta subunit tail domain-containing protein n=1 Tax=Batillaria attramentaria TaxID=370345 RepID=A0ABD0LU61_9CAEN